jgi:hypothetical protein
VSIKQLSPNQAHSTREIYFARNDVFLKDSALIRGERKQPFEQEAAMKTQQTVSGLAKTLASPRGRVAFSALDAVLSAARCLRRLLGTPKCSTPEICAENVDRVLDSIAPNARGNEQLTR